MEKVAPSSSRFLTPGVSETITSRDLGGPGGVSRDQPIQTFEPDRLQTSLSNFNLHTTMNDNNDMQKIGIIYRHGRHW